MSSTDRLSEALPEPVGRVLDDFVEAVLARLYADEVFRRRFLARPFEESARAGLDEGEARALAAVDPAALETAARSFAHKRAGRRRRSGWLRRLFGG